MSVHHNISDLELNGVYAGVYLVKSHAVRTSSSNKPYLDMTLLDRTGEINAKWWNIQNFNCDNLIDSDFIVAKFEVVDFNGSRQLKIQGLKPLTPDIEFDPSDIIPMSPEKPEDMYNEIYNTANSFSNVHLKNITTNILEERKERLLKIPGAKSVHHAVLGGLLLHTVGMLRSAKALAGVYSTINTELLYAGVILHDICKIDEFVVGPIGMVSDYTAPGKLLGHLYMGASYVENKCRELDIPSDISMLLSHMILSHHGDPEFGSAVRPMFVEAAVLHMLDLIDSRVYMFNEATKELSDNTFSQKVFTLDNVQVYKHNLNPQTNNGIDFTNDIEPTEDMF